MSYALSVTVSDSFDDTVTRTVNALAEQGFGVLTTIDLQKVLAEKIGMTIPRQLLLGACRPQLAGAALEAEPSIGLLLPCNVTVQEINGARTQVQILDPSVMISLTNNPALLPMAEDAGHRLSLVLAALGEPPSPVDSPASGASVTAN
ncbi:Uncharacterized conserved protein, DUF302 family [Nakamurella panacisegetis]|uniref:Uncharacterized conserved protein, DUF302 family n=1 Tax=Nakamurella panacisegetis TaxID=1090615 RepID=A0A1H0SXB7_9ACTN|nr:DUF302 domain-containing protein [Nakamurella panacisegetis]SDP46265.1 Uncharacterized conserved protein, DUF302 family [Nakamurella panacisegetis]